MTVALCLDPGKATGAALVRWGDYKPLTVLETWTIPDGCEGFISWWLRQPGELGTTRKRWSIVICELFEIDGTVTGTWAPEIQGALKALWGDPVVWQRRDEKAVIAKGEKERNAWLKWHGINLTTQHERDAVIHGLRFVRKQSHLPSLMHYWPPKPRGEK